MSSNGCSDAWWRQNQEWARRAPVLMLGVVSTKFARNGNDNRVAFHDLGLASASLTFEATSRGLFVHQMAGILPDKARETYAIPEGFEPWTGLAIGYADDSDDVPGQLRARETGPRQRKKLNEFVFEDSWGTARGDGALHEVSGSKTPLSRFLRTLSQGKQRPFMAM